MPKVVDRPSPENLERAKIHFLRAITENKPQIIQDLLDAGYPVDLPIVDINMQTLLMMCA